VQVGEVRLYLIEGQVVPEVGAVDPEWFQAGCVEAFVASWTVRGFSATTIGNDIGVLERVLEALGRPSAPWYHAGLRTKEAVMLDRSDAHFGWRPFGKLHVRFGKGARTSQPRPRWVPILDGVDPVLRWFLDDVRGRFSVSEVLFCDETGGRATDLTSYKITYSAERTLRHSQTF